jgi:23S rRNA (cytosine1962-C5)-methyltransferase
MKKLGPFDCIVVDPPSYQKGSFVAKKDYVKVIRRLPSLLTKDGYALLCLNAPELTAEFLIEGVKEECGTELVFVERLENPSMFASKYPERALKVLLFQHRPSFVSHTDDRSIDK